MKIKLKSTNQKTVEGLFRYWLNQGFLLSKVYSKKRFLLFGEKTYIVEMEQGAESYENLIQQAINEENYEEARRLTTEFEGAKKIEF